MSSTVDNRAVELGFNNRDFERGVATSTKSLDNLKKGLDFTESSKSLNNLATAGKNFSLGNISSSVESISSRFSALGVIGFTVLQNLTNQAIRFGQQLVNRILTPIKTGFSEYETQINAIQTVLANTESKGTTLEDVNAALDELNLYADKTIYNFTEMTKNIGTFTAAGVDLETSTAAIKGIANLAAVSGSTSQQASTAMYQLSQALSSGTVKLMDWNSVVNAGMGGQVFQDALKETARAHGIAIDDMIKNEGSFRETLQKGWLTSDVLLETLKKFTGDLTEEQLTSMGYTEDQIAGILKLGKTASDAATKVKTFSQLKDTLAEALQSGWGQSWRILVGDFEEARSLFTEISDVLGAMIGAGADARNSMLKEWKDFGGRTLAIKALRNSFEAVLAIMAPIKEAFAEIFPPMTGLKLALITNAIANFTEKLKIGSETADKVKRIFKGVFAVLDIGRMLVFTLAERFLELFKRMSPAGKGILDFLANMGDYVLGIRDGIKANDSFNVAIDNIIDFIKTAKERIIDFADAVKIKFGEVQTWFRNFISKINFGPVGEVFGSIFDKIKERLEPLKEILGNLHFQFEPLKTLGLIVGGILKGIAGVFLKVLPGFWEFAKGFGKFLGDLGSTIVEGISNLNFTKLFDVINSGIFAAILLAIRQFITKGGGAFDELGGAFGDLGGIFKSVSGILDGVRGSLEAWQQNLKAKTLFAIAGAIALLAASLLVLSLIDSKKLTFAIGAVTALFVDLMAAMAVMSKTGGGSLGVSGTLLAMATSILIISGALSIISKIDEKDISKSLWALGAIMASLVGFGKAISRNSSNITKTALGLIVFSVALKMIAGVVEKLGALDVVTLTNGLFAIGVLLAEIAIFMQLLKDSGGGVGKGVGLLAMAGALVIISDVVAKLGEMDISALQQGMTALGIVLTEISIFLNLIGDSKRVISTAIGLTILGGALMIFVEVISRLGQLSTDEIGQGLFALGAALAIIAIAMSAMPKNMIITSVGLLIVAGAILILSQALSSMGGMSWDEIARGLVALGGSLLILSVALIAMQGSIAGSLALIIAAGAIAILAAPLKLLGSMSLGEIGRGLLALAGAFLVMGLAGYLLTPVVPTLLGLGAAMLLLGAGALAVGAGVLLFSAGLAALAVSGAAGTAALVLLITTILGLIPLIIQTLGLALASLLRVIILLAPLIGEALKAVALALIDTIVEVTPPLLDGLRVLLLKLIDVIVEVTPKLIDAILFLIGDLLESLAESIPDFVQSGFDILLGIMQGIEDNIGEVVTTALHIISEFIEGIAEGLPDIIQSGFDLIISFIDGLAQGIEDNRDDLMAAVKRLGDALIEGFKDGITSGVGGVVQAITGLAGSAVTALKTLLGIFSPSKVMTKLGEFTVEGFVIGLSKLAGKVVSAVEDIGDKAVSGMGDAVSRINDALVGNIDINPTIRPVMDLSNIVAGSSEMSDILGRNPLNIPLSLNTVSLTSARMSDSKNISSNGSPNNINGNKEVSFVQNNYSPKALSRIDIYRETKNLLNTAKG